jgi:hypothetical protein
MLRASLCLVLVLCACASPARAQDAVASPWTWTTDGNVFVGFNYQQRQFANFSAWESQNWWMGAGERRLGAGRLTVEGMLSLEPLTIGRLVYAGGANLPAGGSPQLFQTGESYQGAPIVNYQHPHDLVMGLGATYRIAASRATYIIGADLVGSATLGPTPFMHRDSARDNPQAPLTHHFLDSTHQTPGVVRVGVEAGGFTFETSAFRGAEPDENRWNIERPALDSYAGRVVWRSGPWNAQFSGGHLHVPEWFEPYDQTRWTASIGFDGAVAERLLAVTLAWGENREFTPYRGVADAYLLEADFRASERTTFYGRAEKARKEILGLGFHPRGFGHPHVFSDIDAVTLGAVRDLPIPMSGRFGIGGDITLYGMSPDMASYYAGSRSYHAFLRWRPGVQAEHVHQ